MSPAYKPVPVAPFLKGLVADTDVYTQPKGSVPRISNMVYTKRGSLRTCDGSLLLSAVGGIVQVTPQGRIYDIDLFQPSSVNPYFLDIQRDLLLHLGAPTGVAVVNGGAGGTLGAATYFYVVTAIDAFGGETLPSAEVNIVNAGGNKNNLSWVAVNHAAGYNVYRSTTTGTEIYLTTITGAIVFSDDGSVTQPSIALASSTSLAGVTTTQYTYVTVTAHGFSDNQIVNVSGVSDPLFNATFAIIAVLDPFTFKTTRFGNQGNHFGAGGVVSAAVFPPIADNTSVVVLRKLPTTVVSYNESTIQAIFPGDLGITLVNPPGSGGGGGGTGGGGSGPGGGGGPVPTDDGFRFV
jgi:hypothetical protein